MIPEVKQYLQSNVIPEFNRWIAKELDVSEIDNVEATEFKIEALARKKAVILVKKFINKITEGEFKAEIEADFGNTDFIVER